jgi:hypothetical protein
MFAQFVVRRISIRDTEISVVTSPKLMENGKIQPVGRAPSPLPALVLLLPVKKTSAMGIIESQKASLLSQKEKARMDGGSLRYKFLEPDAPRKSGPMSSRGFIRHSAGLDIASRPDFAQFPDMIAASNYHSANPRSKSKQEATW